MCSDNQDFHSLIDQSRGRPNNIALHGLTKWYGKSRGIIDLSFEVYAGEVFGFLGPNGSGKTTAMRTILGLIRPTAGSASLLGRVNPIGDLSFRNRIGYLPGVAALYDNYTARGYLHFIARVRKLDLADVINAYGERLDLELDQHIHDLSKGNRQKVALIQAFMHSPELLFLDEPTSGLDPLVQREFETMLAETRTRGASVLLSSHVLSEVEHLADRVAIIDQGKAVAIDEISRLKSRARREIELVFQNPVSASDFAGIEGIKEVETRGHTAHCIITGSERELLRRSVELGVVEVRTKESSLEEIFLDLIGKR